jgi:hypothetical protein
LKLRTFKHKQSVVYEVVADSTLPHDCDYVQVAKLA